MNEEKIISAAGTFFGGVLIALSASLIGNFVFKSNFVMVFVGFVFFAAGYKTTWYCSKIESYEELREISSELVLTHIKLNVPNYLLLSIGVATASLGSIYFAQTIRSFEVSKAVIGSFMVFLGYMLSHEAVNKVLV